MAPSDGGGVTSAGTRKTHRRDGAPLLGDHCELAAQCASREVFDDFQAERVALAGIKTRWEGQSVIRHRQRHLPS